MVDIVRSTGGEPASLETFADVCCTLLQACDRAGDSERPRQWAQVFESFVRTYDHVPLLAFCRSYGADMAVASGRIDDAERELVAALAELDAAGQRSRCVQPAARLAEIRVVQGRFDEAEQLLAGMEHEPEAVGAAVSLRLARGEPAAAVRLLRARLAALGPDNVLAAPLLGQLVVAELGAGDLAAAAAAADELDALAAGRHGRVAATAALARGRVLAAAGDAHAEETLEDAVRRFAVEGLRLDAARSRLELARLLARAGSPAAADVAASARSELDALGADRDADAAAALMRSLGVKAAAGPRRRGDLSRRETEVLRLLGEGLSNAEIAERLFISPKTAEHHVSRIYARLGVRSRAEAAAWAARNLGPE